MESNKPKEITFLSKPSFNKNKMSYLTGEKNIYVNLFKLSILKNWTMYLYSTKIDPEPAYDNTRAKRIFYTQVADQIKRDYGECIFTGEMLYALQEVKDPKEYVFTDSKTNIKYSFLVIKTNESVNINDKNAFQDPAIKQIYELIVKEILKANPALEIYRDLLVKKDESKQVSSQRNKVDFYPGFKTSLVYTVDGTFLNVSIKNKILSSATCWEIIKDKEKAKMSQDELREYFVGRQIKTTYTKKTYTIEDVSFDKTPTNTTFNREGKSMTLVNYYKVAHNITLKDVRQPLFIIKKEDKQTGQQIALYFIPELCKLAGIDDSVAKDGKFMQSLAAYTKLRPEERIEKTNEIFNLMNERNRKTIVDRKTGKEISKLKSPAELKSLYQLDIAPADKNKFSAQFMSVPKIISKNKSYSTDERKPFPAAATKDFTKWICVYHKENFDDANTFLKSLQQASKAYGIKVADPEWVEMTSTNAKDWTSQVESYNPNQQQFVVFLLDNYIDKLYKQLKTHSLVSAGYISQVVKPESLRKNAMSVCSKILLQINYKIGGASYNVDFDKSVSSKKMMIIGVDSSHIAGKRTGVAMTATMNKEFTSFYNKIDIIPEQKKEQLIYCVSSFIKEAISRYFVLHNKSELPSHIVIYRQGVSREQKTFLKEEVDMINGLLNGTSDDNLLKGNNIPYYYILVNTKTSFKFFEEQKSYNRTNYNNPNPGLLVMNQVTDPNFFEFYIQPQMVTGGTATPTLYHVAFGTMTEPEIIPKLTFDLCHLYANWQGAVRVPGPLKNAEKLSKITAKYTKGELHDRLRNSLAYL